MKQYSETQYDVDLTLGNDEYDESYYSDADDLFEFSTDDESPISRLKSLVLSIDWEITDDVLLQFNEELLDLKDIWAGDTINLVYVQALEKISKYIYQNKADSHPNAIKLLLTFYYNLEKIVSSHELSDDQKKEILLEDVKKFENLKRQIKQKAPSDSEPETKQQRQQVQKLSKETSSENELFNLKAIVLGIDWEITEQDLNDLRREVIRLEEKFSNSRPKLILLQGIGTLAAYIKIKKSNAHPDAFKVLQLFYESLEKLVHTPMGLEGEKAVLFPAVEKFNAFKEVLGPTIAPEAISREDEDVAEDYAGKGAGEEIAPALAGFVEEEGSGFQAEKAAMELGLHDSVGVNSHLDNFFGESSEAESLVAEDAKIESEIIAAAHKKLEFSDDLATSPVAKEVALQGVDVEEDDGEDLDIEKIVAGHDEDSPVDLGKMTVLDEEGDDSAGASISQLKKEGAQEEPRIAEELILGATESIFPDDNGETRAITEEFGNLDREKALAGVNVETEADDDTDELSLPMEGEELAPALAALEEESLFSAQILDKTPASGSVTDEIVGTIDGLFSDHEQGQVSPAVADKSEESPVVDSRDEILSEEEDLLAFEDWVDKQPDSETLVIVQEEAGLTTDKDEELLSIDQGRQEEISSSGVTGDQPEAFEEDAEQEEDALTSFLSDSEIEQSITTDSEIDALFDSLETADADQADGFISLEDEVASEPPADTVLIQAGPDIADDEALSLDTAESLMTRDRFEEAVDKSSSSVDFSAEEEVVFELLEEETAPLETAMVAREADSRQLGIELGQESGENLFTGTVLSSREADVDAPVTGDRIILGAQQISDPFADLKACVHSLEIEVNDAIIAGLFQEINRLRQQASDQPVTKIFLQLLSTVSQHIDHYRYESSALAHGLLVSIGNALSSLQKEDDVGKNLELLLIETHKVLEWQQEMLARQSVKRGEQLTFVDPLRTESTASNQIDAQQDFDDLLERYEDTSEEMSAVVEGGGDVFENKQEKSDSPSASSGIVQEIISDDLKKEIAALRQTLQLEIAELRRELRKE